MYQNPLDMRENFVYNEHTDDIFASSPKERDYIMRMASKWMAATLAGLLTVVSIPINALQQTQAADFSVWINEICTQNKSCLTDSYGVYSDWIELYNSSDSAIDLSGYGLSDDPTKPLQFTFPEGTVIAAGEHRILFASKQASTASELHTGFALSKNGETVTLASPSGAILQKIAVPALGKNVTYGRSPDGSDTFEIMTATPGTANEIVIDTPVFSASSGFYGTDFSLTLTSSKKDTIYYTLDGSDPTTSETAQIYTDAILVQDRTDQANLWSALAEDNNSATSISRGTGYKAPNFNVDKATVVRAAVQNADGVFSDVVSQTYFVTTSNLAQYQDLTVVSLVTNPENLFDPDTGIYVTGNQYLDWKNSDAYNPDKSVWDTDNLTNYFSKGKEWEREAALTVFQDGKAVVDQNIGIRIKGASSRNSAQKNFNLYARSTYGASKISYPLIPDNYAADGTLIDQYDSVSLRAVSEEGRLRDGFSQKLLTDRTDLTKQDMQSCVVFLNGEYWGLYEMTEKLSDDFIKSNYDIPKENVAMIKNGALEEGSQTELNNFYQFFKKYAAADLTNEDNYQAVCDFVDIDSMIEHYAAGIYLGTYDWPNYNYGVWRNTGDTIAGNPYSNGKWRFISFDYDYTMGKTYKDFGGVEGYAYDNFQHVANANGFPTNLFLNLLHNEDFRNKFVNVYCDYANEVLTPEKADAMIATYKQDYTEQLANTTVRWWGFFGGTKENNLRYQKNTYLNTTLPQIQTFFQKRADYTIEDMCSYLNLSPSMQTITLKTNGNGSIQINSIVPDAATGWSGQYSPDCPITLTAIPAKGAEFLGWGGDLSSTETTVTLTLKETMSITANFSGAQAVLGDVNADGVCSVADAVLLQKWLLRAGEITDWQASDFDENQVLDIVDLALLKRKLLNK